MNSKVFKNVPGDPRTSPATPPRTSPATPPEIVCLKNTSLFLRIGLSPESAGCRPTATTSFSGMSEELPRFRCGKRGTFTGQPAFEKSRKIPPPFSSAWTASHQAGHLSVMVCRVVDFVNRIAGLFMFCLSCSRDFTIFQREQLSQPAAGRYCLFKTLPRMGIAHASGLCYPLSRRLRPC